MTASDNLQPKQMGKYLYHEAPVGVRSSIQQEGLRPNKPFTPQAGEDVYPHGIYLSPSQHSEYGSSYPGHDGPWFGMDRWRVNVEGLKDVGSDPDPFHPHTFFTPHAITPDRLTLAKKAHPDWEKHL